MYTSNLSSTVIFSLFLKNYSVIILLLFKASKIFLRLNKACWLQISLLTAYTPKRKDHKNRIKPILEANFMKKGLQITPKNGWGKLYEKPLSRQEYEEIRTNLYNFFELIKTWDNPTGKESKDGTKVAR